MLLLSLFVLVASAAEPPRFDDKIRAELRDTAKFHALTKASDLPEAVRKVCGPGTGAMADPGGKWEPTDDIADPTLPAKRLIWAATDGRLYVVHYETGGYAHLFHVAIIRTEAPQTAWIWQSVQPKGMPTLLETIAGKAPHPD